VRSGGAAAVAAGLAAARGMKNAAMSAATAAPAPMAKVWAGAQDRAAGAGTAVALCGGGLFA
jgi:hypothetical protein